MFQTEKLLENFEDVKLDFSLDKNVELIKKIFEKDKILRVRHIKTGGKTPIRATIFFMDSMIDTIVLNESIVKPLLLCENDVPKNDIADFVTERVLFAAEINRQITLGPLLRNLLYGDTVLLFDNCNVGINVNTKGWRTRGISEPENEKVIEGPREGFEEAIITSGGVSLSEINPKTMESKKMKGIRFCGEVLDVDAFTGGFNLQIAFATGFAARNRI